MEQMERMKVERTDETERERRGRVVVRRAWWNIHGCQEGSMASHTHLGSPSGESKQPYKVAGLRFNPKFISSISKSLSRNLEERARG